MDDQIGIASVLELEPRDWLIAGNHLTEVCDQGIALEMRGKQGTPEGDPPLRCKTEKRDRKEIRSHRANHTLSGESHFGIPWRILEIGQFEVDSVKVPCTPCVWRLPCSQRSIRRRKNPRRCHRHSKRKCLERRCRGNRSSHPRKRLPRTSSVRIHSGRNRIGSRKGSSSILNTRYLRLYIFCPSIQRR